MLHVSDFDNANDTSVLIIGTVLCALANSSLRITFKPALVTSNFKYIFVIFGILP